jgi:hypothetical protein
VAWSPASRTGAAIAGWTVPPTTADSSTPMRTPRLLLDLLTMLLVLLVAAAPTVNGRPS